MADSMLGLDGQAVAPALSGQGEGTVQVNGPSVKITVRPNGPFRVEGAIALVDVNGKEWDLTGKPAISLCRCGLSSKRPFCDGEHGRQGWKCDASPIPAVPVAQG